MIYKDDISRGTYLPVDIFIESLKLIFIYKAKSAQNIFDDAEALNIKFFLIISRK